ncbi:MAG TPA: tRNA U-34 5-methylaminomethyl-2-thiouridine biosynthesis protein, partial [Rubrivivax sp.]|nr:tRNA U-34 5-methylaminomethyl-2-thiouridine biosynthesis protein [Rubrivivax sp.]
PQPLPVPPLQGRVAWRCVAADRLPLVGAVPDEAAAAAQRCERLHDVPRRPGLYVFSALGSRGIAWSGLGAQVLAAQITGAPLPLESPLADALDPARWLLRARRALRSGG